MYFNTITKNNSSFIFFINPYRFFKGPFIFFIFFFQGSSKTLPLLALLSTTAFAKLSFDFQWADFMERFEEEKTDDDDIDSVDHDYHIDDDFLLNLEHS